MSNKPLVYVWSLGEGSVPRDLYQQFHPSTAWAEPVPFIEAESEGAVYRMLARVGSPTRVDGVILTIEQPKLFSAALRAILLVASRYTSQLVVLFLGCESFSDEDVLDQKEKNIRYNLSMVGFDGDAATVMRWPSAILGEEGKAALLDTLDGAIRPQRGSKTPSELPSESSERKLAEALISLKGMVRLKSELVLSKMTPEALFDREGFAQFGGMPYLELGEMWPTCQQCRAELHFLWQLDARLLRPAIPGAGLFVFYVCEQRRGYCIQSLIVRHYKEPERERRKKPTGLIPQIFEGTNRPITPSAVGYRLSMELPHANELKTIGHAYHFDWKSLAGLLRGQDADYVYDELCRLLGVEPASYDAARPGPMQLGGYSAPTEGLHNPICSSCKKVMRTLANVHRSYELGFPWGDQRFQFFLCGCKPGELRTVSLNDRRG